MSLCRSLFFLTLAILSPAAKAEPEKRTTVPGEFGKLPIYFETNVGQFAPQVRFGTEYHGFHLQFEDRAVDFRADGKSFLRMRWSRKRQGRSPLAEDLLDTKINYFIGSDPSRWRTDVPTFSQIRYPSAFPGIDLVFYANRDQFEYDVVVAPGGNADQITFQFDGASSIKTDERGNLVLCTPRGLVIQRKPFLYQKVHGERVPVSGQYVLRGQNQVAIRVGDRDRTRAVIIDPVLDYSLLFGGSTQVGEYGAAIAVDAGGNTYITGATSSADFDLAGIPFQNQLRDNEAAFVAKLNPTGTSLVYCTYLGGSGYNPSGTAIAVDQNGNVVVAGQTSQTDFPVTPGAFETTKKGTVTGFVTKLNATGSALIYSTYFGGSSFDYLRAMAVDSQGSAYLTGNTTSPDFPLTQGAFDGTKGMGTGGGGVFLTKLSPDGSSVLYSTIISPGGIGFAITLDASGNAYVAGMAGIGYPVTPGAFQTQPHSNSGNAFVMAVTADGSAQIFSTLLGGSYHDIAHGIARDSFGNVYVTGSTQSLDFPITPGAYQTSPVASAASMAFITKLNATGTAVLYSTFYASGAAANFNSQIGNAIVVDSAQNAVIAGTASGSPLGSLPLVSPIQAVPTIALASGTSTGFIAKFNAQGSGLIYGTYVGGSIATGLAIDSNSNVYVTGAGASSNLSPPFTPPTGAEFPVTFDSNSAGLNHGWVFAAKLEDPTPCTFSISPQSFTLPVTPSSTTVNVTASTPNCNWVAVGGQYWISAGPGSAGKGSGQATVNVSANDGPARSASVSIAGSIFTVSQPSNCTYSLSSSSQSLDSGGGIFWISSIDASDNSCPLTAQSNAPSWIVIQQMRTQPYGVQISVAANPGSPRSGTLTIAGLTFTVNEAGGFTCTYSLPTTTIDLSWETQPSTVIVNSPCTWTATSNASWISINTPSGVTPNGVLYDVATNTGPVRSGTITISGLAFTITQESAVSPLAGSGQSQIFAANYTEGIIHQPNLAYFMVGNVISSANSCFVEYNAASNTFRFMTDGGTTWSGPIPAGAGGISNSQCSFSGVGAGKVLSQNFMTVTFPITFSASYSGAKNVYTLQIDSLGQNTGWQQVGTFNVTGSGGGGGIPPGAVPVCNPSGAPCVVSLTPTNGSGLTGTFTGVFTHSGGANQHYLGYILFLPTPNVVQYTATGSCLVEYNRISNAMRLINDAGTNWLPGVIGLPISQPGTLSNSHCTLNVGQSSAVINGTTMTVTAAMTFNSGFTGQLATFMQAFDVTGAYTGMTQFGNWIAAPGPQAPGPYVVGMTPTSGAGSSTILTFKAGHTSGVSSLSFVTMLISSVIVGGTPCQAFYFPAANVLNLVNDAGTAMVSNTGIAPGTAGTLSNSRCTINTGMASKNISGNNVTVGLPMTFSTTNFGGAKNVYLNAFDNFGSLSHWVTGGSWTVQ